MVITAVPAAGSDLGGILTEIERVAQEVLPPRARLGFLGTSQELQESSAQFYVVLALGLLVVYLVLAALFGSFVFPFAVLFSVPISVAGGIAALLLFGMSLNIFS